MLVLPLVARLAVSIISMDFNFKSAELYGAMGLNPNPIIGRKVLSAANPALLDADAKLGFNVPPASTLNVLPPIVMLAGYAGATPLFVILQRFDKSLELIKLVLIVPE